VLRTVEARIRDANELINGVSVGRIRSYAVIHADAESDVQRTYDFREDDADAFAESEGLRSVGLGKQQGKFVPAEAESGVGSTKRSLQRGGDGAKNIVTARMAELVVDFFEAMQVERNQAERLGVAFGTIEFFLEGDVEQTAIVEAGERVGDCAAFEIFQLVALDEKRELQDTGRSEYVDHRGEKRDGLRRGFGESGAALQDFVPELERAIFGEFETSVGAEETAKKLTA
jgi:hypothetical protein